ncbi:nucleotidyl transferase AbiEii/AbiGii toxin family protein [Mycetocola lacteus]|uniref:Nucleotidyl transferase AbiEii/AbiGii toxin family protein n=1 Tax=Mycetocola lacteus TaxID=76637 RepID=A0A3L7ARA4_9MICO|nr:nucleotidyl transferase AbiEii/AbiGii toxin family protein [Mycetocola lacteus]RLP83029.1 nucleotidyl transferase AbiEii/AbiGii toxin family protein [Mycetocola lacteus]
MNASAQHGTPAGDATLAIQALARKTGANVQELLTLYALEALLERISRSPDADDFVLKGGVLLAAFEARRPTQDIDVQVSGLVSRMDVVAEKIRAIARIEVDDGVVFEEDSMVVSVIRDSDEYSGVRVKLTASLGRARLFVGIDVNFGDPIWPEPQRVRIPRLVALGQPVLEVLGYPMVMVLAEKISTVMERGLVNSRWRDFADIYVLSHRHGIHAGELRTALGVVTEYRGIRLLSVFPLLNGMQVIAQPHWVAWRFRTSRTTDLPESFAEVLEALSAFVDPLLSSDVKGTWDPVGGHWTNQDLGTHSPAPRF